jgi:hypothetical protein
MAKTLSSSLKAQVVLKTFVSDVMNLAAERKCFQLILCRLNPILITRLTAFSHGYFLPGGFAHPQGCISGLKCIC